MCSTRRPPHGAARYPRGIAALGLQRVPSINSQRLGRGTSFQVCILAGPPLQDLPRSATHLDEPIEHDNGYEDGYDLSHPCVRLPGTTIHALTSRQATRSVADSRRGGWRLLITSRAVRYHGTTMTGAEAASKNSVKGRYARLEWYSVIRIRRESNATQAAKGRPIRDSHPSGSKSLLQM